MSKNYSSLAMQLFERGYEPIPIAPSQKYPTLKNWQNLQLPIAPWPDNHGVGLRTGRSIWFLDIDITNTRMVGTLLSFIDFPHITRTGKYPKIGIPILCPEVEKKHISDGYVDGNGEIHRIEILSDGQQFVAYGIHPDTDKHYEWSGDLLTHTLPEISKDWILHFFELFYDLASKAGWQNISGCERKAEETISERSYQDKDTGSAPGSIYNRSVSIATVLQHYDWRHYRGQYWTRPGKKTGVSASVFDDRILWPFTSSTQLQPDRAYDAFELLVQYEFNGDKSAAARALKEAA